MKTFKYMSQPFEANNKDLEFIDSPGSIFNGSISKTESEYKGFNMKGEWHGVDSWHSVIEDKNGKIVAEQVSFTHYNGSTEILWSVSDNAPSWMREHDELSLAQAENDRLHDEAHKHEMFMRKEREEFNDILSRYHGTRLLNHLDNLGKSNLSYLAN